MALNPIGRKGWEDINLRFSQMLEDGRHIFDAAANALVGGTEPDVIRDDLFRTDQRINETEQQIRRMIVVHGSVHGALSFPALLVMMSLSKDAERIGDYAKNIFDLAAARPDLGADAGLLTQLKDEISQLLVRGRNLHSTQDEEGARRFLAEADAVQDTCDAELTRCLAVQGTNVSANALAFRYFKRVASHMANVVTALVMPLDKLDFFDEP